MDQIYDTKGAAKRLGLSESLLSKLRCAGGGPRYIKVGRRVLYLERELAVWLESNVRANTSESGCAQ